MAGHPQMMNLLISLLVLGLICGGALAGMAVRPLLSEHHLHTDTKDVVRLTAGLIGTLTALVLGLLIASAKTTFDAKTDRVRHMTATVILLDDLLMQYGPEAIPLRKLLRQSISPMADRIWHEQENSTGRPTRFEASAEAWEFYSGLERLSPNNDTQRSLQSRALAAFTEGAQMRLQLFTQVGRSIPTPFLVIMVFWLSAIFFSATLFARANRVVALSLFVCAVSFAGAIFLVLEMDDPFAGLMGISSSTLRNALSPLS
jgi:hypothetical protein